MTGTNMTGTNMTGTGTREPQDQAPAGLELTRARKLALCVGVPFVLAAVVGAGLCCVALVGRGSYRFRSGPIGWGNPATVTVALGSGHLAMTDSGSPPRERWTYDLLTSELLYEQGDMEALTPPARLSGTVDYTLVRPRVTWRGTSLSQGNTIVFHGPSCFADSCDVNLGVAVPWADEVDVTAAHADIAASFETMFLELKDGSGDIDVRGGALDGPQPGTVLDDGSGDIRGTDLLSGVSAKDGSGNVDLSFDVPPPDVDVTDTSGDVTLHLPVLRGIAYRVDARAFSGTVHIDVPTSPSSELELHLRAGSGNITVLPATSAGLVKSLPGPAAGQRDFVTTAGAPTEPRPRCTTAGRCQSPPDGSGRPSTSQDAWWMS
jgi:hypothetical protein